MIATASGLSVVAKRPPSVRDFQIYRFVRFECNSTREAAHEFSISQTRVRQIISRVMDFFVESAPTGDGDKRLDPKAVAAEQLSREHLQYMYQRAMKCFDDTQTEDADGNLLPGKVVYLAMAARIVLWMSEVPLHGLPEFSEDEEELDSENRYDGTIDHDDPQVQRIKQQVLDEIEEVNARAEAAQEAARLNVAAESERIHQAAQPRRPAPQVRVAASQPGANPPDADCSAVVNESRSGTRQSSESAEKPEVWRLQLRKIHNLSADEASRGEVQPAADAEVTATASENGSYRSLDEIKAEARKRFLSTAQPVCEPPLQSPAVGEGERSAADQPRPPLSRKERRARERMLKRALAKR